MYRSVPWIISGLLMLVPSQTAAQWRTINFVDEFGDVTGRGAVSAAVTSIRPMSFPYNDTTGTIMVNCDDVWIRFSDSPNLVGGATRTGYDIHGFSVRLDGDDIGRWTARQAWGGNDLTLLNDAEAIAALSSGSTFAIALPWYGESSVAFSWSLNGSSGMIQESCD